MAYEATSSFDSVNGPSVTVTLPPATRMRAPFALGCSPSVATNTPAFDTSSMNTPIRCISSGLGGTPASDSASARSNPRNRIVVSVGLGVKLSGLCLGGRRPAEGGDLGPGRPVHLGYLGGQGGKDLAQNGLRLVRRADVTGQGLDHSPQVDARLVAVDTDHDSLPDVRW